MDRANFLFLKLLIVCQCEAVEAFRDRDEVQENQQATLQTYDVTFTAEILPGHLVQAVLTRMPRAS